MSTQIIKPNCQDESHKGFIIIKTPHSKEQHEISSFFSIGRTIENNLNIRDSFVSSRHSRIEKKGNRFFIKDLQSSNGTYLNGTKVITAPLKHLDHIKLGKTELIFSFERDIKKYEIFSHSKNTLLQNQLQTIPNISQSELPVLITGPSGTGKEVIAQLIHRNSLRHNGPFISVNCGALSESLIESELFGHLKGSFTGASHDRKGAFEAARGGTLFLDEVGDLPLNLQPKLLRALENQEIRPLGSDQNIRTDIRLVAATHGTLKQKVADKQFREDLFFRLNVIHFDLPPLKQRLEDFENLLYYFAKDLKVKFNHASILALKKHSWPGNIRELKNAVARASALFKHQEITEEMTSALIDLIPTNTLQVNSKKIDSVQSLREIEKKMICDTLISHRGNQRQTALDLGMPKSTLNDKIKNYSINIKELLIG